MKNVAKITIYPDGFCFFPHSHLRVVVCSVVDDHLAPMNWWFVP
jgi:hypothetical protein